MATITDQDLPKLHQDGSASRPLLMHGKPPSASSPTAAPPSSTAFLACFSLSIYGLMPLFSGRLSSSLPSGTAIFQLRKQQHAALAWSLFHRAVSKGLAVQQGSLTRKRWSH